MRAKQIGSKLLMSGLLAAAVAGPAWAQSSPSTPPSTPPAATTMTAPRATGDLWRTSKLMGLDVYNDQNEKLGDISEVLIDKSGSVKGVVIGVGGFLGMGEHNIMVEMNKLKFVDQPMRTSSSTSTTGGTGTTTGAATGTSRPATTTTTTSSSSNGHKWYPDHAVLSGASKDQLKNMPEFKYQ